MVCVTGKTGFCWDCMKDDWLAHAINIRAPESRPLYVTSSLKKVFGAIVKIKTFTLVKGDIEAPGCSSSNCAH